MTINKDTEAVRQLNVESAYFYTETGNPGDSLSGPEAAAIKMTNDEGQRCTLAHHHSGITRFETEGEMIVSAGEKTPSGNSDFILVTNSGDVDVVAEDGNVRIRADNNITLEADNIVIKANSIQMGDGNTSDVAINGSVVNISSNGGNTGVLLSIHGLSGSVKSIGKNFVNNITSAIKGMIK